MSNQSLKAGAVVCFLVCAVLLFVAFERYNTNAGNVQAMNQFSQSTPFGSGMGGMGGMGGGQLRPATPAATKYALVFALIAGAGGVFCLVQLKNYPSTGGPSA